MPRSANKSSTSRKLRVNRTQELEQAMDSALGNPGLFSHGAHAPMCCGLGLASECLGDQLGYRLVLHGTRPAGTHLVVESARQDRGDSPPGDDGVRRRDGERPPSPSGEKSANALDSYVDSDDH
jgi:hypothetical protein